MKNKITNIKSRWILDSRGNPTVETEVYSNQLMGRAAVPSGASTGELEALELRDGGKVFKGKHVTTAVSNVNNIIAKTLIGLDPTEQEEIDRRMLELDGTDNKSKLGANAILSVSLAVAKLGAIVLQKPLFQYLYELIHNKSHENFLLPLVLIRDDTQVDMRLFLFRVMCSPCSLLTTRFHSALYQRE